MSFLASDEKLSRGVYSFCPALPSLLFESMIGITWKFLVFWFTLLKLSIAYRCSFPLPLPPLFLDKHCRFTVFSDVWKWARWGVGGCVVFLRFVFALFLRCAFSPGFLATPVRFSGAVAPPPFGDRRGESLWGAPMPPVLGLTSVTLAWRFPSRWPLSPVGGPGRGVW